MIDMKSSLSSVLKIWAFLLMMLWILLPLSGNARNMPKSVNFLPDGLERFGPDGDARDSLEDREFLTLLQDFLSSRAWLVLELQLALTYPDIRQLDEAVKQAVAASSLGELRDPRYAEILGARVRRYMAGGGADVSGTDLALVDSPVWTALSAASEQAGSKVERKRDADARSFTSSDDFMNSPDYLAVVFTLKRKYPEVEVNRIEWAVWIVAKTSAAEELRRADYPLRLVAKVEERMNYPNRTCADCDAYLGAVDAVLRGPAWLRFLYNLNAKYPAEEGKPLVRDSLGDVISASSIDELRLANYTDVLMGRIDALVAAGNATDTGAAVAQRRRRDNPAPDIQEQTSRSDLRLTKSRRPTSIVDDDDLEAVNHFHTALHLQI